MQNNKSSMMAISCTCTGREPSWTTFYNNRLLQNTHTHSHINKHTHACPHTHTHTHKHASKHACTNTHRSTHTRTHARTHANTHTHTHTHSLIVLLLSHRICCTISFIDLFFLWVPYLFQVSVIVALQTVRLSTVLSSSVCPINRVCLVLIFIIIFLLQLSLLSISVLLFFSCPQNSQHSS